MHCSCVSAACVTQAVVEGWHCLEHTHALLVWCTEIGHAHIEWNGAVIVNIDVHATAYASKMFSLAPQVLCFAGYSRRLFICNHESLVGRPGHVRAATRLRHTLSNGRGAAASAWLCEL